MSCWMLMAFLKGADNRKSASFAVRPGKRSKAMEEAEENAYYDREDDYLYSHDEENEDEEQYTDHGFVRRNNASDFDFHMDGIDEDEIEDEDYNELADKFDFDDDDDEEGAWS